MKSKEIKPGGKREGAGRKPHLHSKDYEARQLFKDAFDSIVDIKHWKEFIKKYKLDPKVFPYLADQRIGKAAMAVELSGKDGGPIKTQVSLAGFDKMGKEELMKIAAQDKDNL